MTPNYTRKTVILVRHPNGTFELETKIHKQRGTQSEITSDGGQFKDLEDVMQRIGYFMGPTE